MSLINDALKRARQAQNQAPAPVSQGPVLRPVVPSPPLEENRPVLPIITFGIVVVLILLLAWQAMRMHREGGTEIQANAKTLSTQTVPLAQTETEPLPAPPTPAPVPEVVAVTPELTNTVVAPAPLPKLQAIIYSPSRPSAIIDGQSLFVGESVGALRLVSVTQNSATLVGNGETNRLTLAH